jgi:uncharacterized protein with PIN domain
MWKLLAVYMAISDRDNIFLYDVMLTFCCRVMRIYFRGQIFLQKGLLHSLGSVKNGRGEILIRKYVMLCAKKWHSGLYLVC